MVVGQDSGLVWVVITYQVKAHTYALKCSSLLKLRVKTGYSYRDQKLILKILKILIITAGEEVSLTHFQTFSSLSLSFFPSHVITVFGIDCRLPPKLCILQRSSDGSQVGLSKEKTHVAQALCLEVSEIHTGHPGVTPISFNQPELDTSW